MKFINIRELSTGTSLIYKPTCTSRPRRSPIGWRKPMGCPTPRAG
ncbi:MAG: hypothetical protein [Olavius algarvensis Gamma 1 endosymbiont]|nr:MAG: hypothetical protein [Olavius algarvensis Gamma 1 endosymbiont]